ncbi:MAG TPA: ATP-binding protein [Terriglobales bacterium]|nr:ATP-binding protein [Terriglobales bacterium]
MEMRYLQSRLRRAVDDYNMIAPGDRVAVGLSGGKDSMTLVAGLAGLRKYYDKPFELIALNLDPGFAGEDDFSAQAAFCESYGVPLHIKKTEIGPIIFDIRKEQNPCSLCAKMRRGALANFATLHGCNKIALGHHMDDAIETLMLSLFFEGRISCFSPVTYLSNTKLTTIRPLIYLEEKDTKAFVKKNAVPVYMNPCCANGKTKRQYVKELLRTLEEDMPGLRERMFGALQRSEIDGWLPASKGRKQ